jgi:hypothetical protein
VTMLKDDKNQNGKETTKTKLTGKKARKLSKKRDKIGKIQKIPKGTLQNWSFVEISKQRHMALYHGKAI